MALNDRIDWCVTCQRHKDNDCKHCSGCLRPDGSKKNYKLGEEGIEAIKKAGSLMRQALEDVDCHGQHANSGARATAERAWDALAQLTTEKAVKK